MSDPTENQTLSAGQFYAEGVLQTIRQFVTDFGSRADLHSLRQIVDGDEEFLGGIVRQNPERYTEDNLIRPLLETLGYENIISQPADLVKDERSTPDFKVNGVAPSCTCIVEAKRLGRFDPSHEQNQINQELSAYLDENALTKYKRDLDTTYLMGIGTDGLTWVLYGKHLDTNEQTIINTASLHKPVKHAVLAQHTEDTTGDSWITTYRPYVQDHFVSTFTANAASQTVIATLSN